ncbi:hypothetical protein AA313_de0202111 [Arthrobotrys entomopaga]|nr:hypothetical protein AA313_de0202111 [Arthrobotrys entomopaga]
MQSKLILAVLLSTLASQVSSHGLIIAAVGDQGGPVGNALGVIKSTPRNGSTPKPFEQDTTVFSGQNSIAAAKGCGATPKGGRNNIAEQVNAMAAAGQIATIAPGGELRMTLHQVNGDGAGPFSCGVDTTGTGANFVPLLVSQQVAGTDGNSNRLASTNALFVRFGAGTRCTGTFGNVQGVCMVRCQNTAKAGPFGGCVPVQIVDPAAAAAAAQQANAAKKTAQANAAAKKPAAQAAVKKPAAKPAAQQAAVKKPATGAAAKAKAGRRMKRFSA